MGEVFLLLVTIGFSAVFAVGGCLRWCSFLSPRVSPREPAAELDVTLPRLSRHQLPHLQATEAGRSMKLDFSATNQIQGQFEICW